MSSHLNHRSITLNPEISKDGPTARKRELQRPYTFSTHTDGKPFSSKSFSVIFREKKYKLIVIEHLLHTKAFGSIVPLIISTLATVHSVFTMSQASYSKCFIFIISFFPQKMSCDIDLCFIISLTNK